MIKRWVTGKMRSAHGLQRGARGQALVEYALILALLVISFGVVLAATGPAIGNVFGNVVYNVIGQDPALVTPIGTYGVPNSFWSTVTWVAANGQQETPFSSAFTPPANVTATALSPIERTGTALANGSATGVAQIAAAATSTQVAANTNAAGTATQNAEDALGTLVANYTPTDVPVFALPFVDQANFDSRWRVGDPAIDYNPDNVNPTACTWETVLGDGDSASRDRFWDNIDGDTFPANTTCYLEVRGKIDLGSAARPIVSFWERHDFSGANGITVSMEVAPWVEAAGVFDRASAVWSQVWSQAATGTNFNWQRFGFNLNNSTTADQIALRFKIQSGGTPSALVRWFIDDIQIVDDVGFGTTYGLNKLWDLNTRDQMNDFIFTADSTHTLNEFGSIAWRWNLTSQNTAPGGGFAFDAFPSLNTYPIPSQTGTTQQYVLQTRYPINLTTAALTDSQGDAGALIVSYQQAYEVPLGATLQLQYTNDVTSLNPTWTQLATLLDKTGADLKSRSSLAMSPVEVRVDTISSQPFLLRWAMTIDAGATGGEGWYIDNISFEREAGSRYRPYPFVDDAEDSGVTTAQWQAVGSWAASNDANFGGFNGSSNAYNDSPSANFTPAVTTSFETRRIIDLLDDTTNKPVGDDDGARPVATDPHLTFWMKRDLSANVDFTVDVWLRSTDSWTTIWTFDADTNAPVDNLAWERIEIDLKAGVILANGAASWANVTDFATVAEQIDDDIRLRFNLIPTGSATAARGVYIDDIFIGELPETEWNLWTAGNGVFFEDNVQFASAGLAPTIDERWWLGAFSVQTLTSPSTCATLYDYRKTSTGSVLTDSPDTVCPDANLGNIARYGADNRRIVELRNVVDLSGTPTVSTTVVPTLSFWTRRAIGADDTLTVQIAVENTADNTQRYDKLAGWNAWVSVWNNGEQRRDTWQRELVDLSSYATADNRIRIRFVLQSNSATTTVADGWYIDGIRVDYTRAQTALPFDRDDSSVTNPWLFEGNWGAANDVFWYEDLASASEALGGGLWNISVHDETDGADLNTYTFFQQPAAYTSTTPDINLFMGSAGLPFTGAPATFLDDYSIRWTRTINLNPGSYTFSIMGDDGYRLYMPAATAANTDVTAVCGSPGVATQVCIINRWQAQSTTLYARTVTVGTAIVNGTLTLDYFEDGGDANIAMSVIKDQYSFTDSPNALTTTTRTSSLRYGDSSMLLRGFVNTSGGGTLNYRRIYALGANMRFFVEQSTDGGFTWVLIASESLTGAAQVLPFEYDGNNPSVTASQWQPRTVPLTSDANLMIRFRINTTTTTIGNLKDGVYLADISITSP